VAPAPPEVVALTERQFSTTQKSPPSSVSRHPDGGTGVIIGVASAALFVGLIGGLFWFRAQRNLPDPNRALPKPIPAAQPDRRPSEPKVAKSQAPQPSATASSEQPLLEFIPGDAASAAPPPSADPAAPDGRPPPRSEPSASSPTEAAPKASAGAPDAGWVKPSWAIPDGDPVRRAPIVE
jgi:hypothetical protein